jgi:hypothetical protein
MCSYRHIERQHLSVSLYIPFYKCACLLREKKKVACVCGGLNDVSGIPIDLLLARPKEFVVFFFYPLRVSRFFLCCCCFSRVLQKYSSIFTPTSGLMTSSLIFCFKFFWPFSLFCCVALCGRERTFYETLNNYIFNFFFLLLICFGLGRPPAGSMTELRGKTHQRDFQI